MASFSKFSNLLRSPLAPVPCARTFRASAMSAPRVKCSSVLSMRNCCLNCLVMAFLGSVSTATRSSSVSSLRVASTGNRPTNSGIRPCLMRSVLSTLSSASLSGLASLAHTFSPKPMEPTLAREATVLSSPTKAPPHMKRMSLVSIWMCSPLGFFRPPFSGTFTTVPSSILRSACCTPSPETSRVMELLSLLRAILSISSMYTMPCCAMARLYCDSCSSLCRMFSTSSPTYPAWVSDVASAWTKGTWAILASVFARSVLPLPVGPTSSTLLLSGITSSSSCFKQSGSCSCPAAASSPPPPPLRNHRRL
mmetsp:Transcript_9916/g.34569  ORF Transcript_9916/g.34569 Transcript_9916/m.34569 type:complete len:308 (+) Transcript_9916:1594-2517(+)